ncbi:GFA family protein [Terricaulis sp.]|uniref:GFA family protein n=1 Tax=Terricaulis sp. TaxID=2768686 RepID=UPI0037843A65
MHKGSCLCGAVTFEVSVDLPPADGCHCTQCRKSSGHYFVSTNVPRAAFTLHGAENVTWYRSSEKVRRGFCAKCGSSLFWDPIHHDWTSIALGAFDTPTRTSISEHIYVAGKGDYYDIADGKPQFDTVPPRPGA